MSRTVVFLFDVDNTLLDNDRVTGDLKCHLAKEVGHERQERYWTIFEQLRVELGYADYLGALQRYRVEHPRDPHLLTVSRFLVNYPFANRLFPNSLDVVEHVKQWGKAVILSDGDVVFQPRKIDRSGLFEAVEGNVLIYIHKERELEDVGQRYPADHYVLIDDKLRIQNGGQENLENPGHHGVPAAGPLCAGSPDPGEVPAGGQEHRAHRRSAPLRPADAIIRGPGLSLKPEVRRALRRAAASRSLI
jgi:hypothetical protein